LTAANDTLFGATSSGGSTLDAGTVFSLNASGAGFAVLHTFGTGSDGTHPRGSVIDVRGVLFGTTPLPDAEFHSGALTSANGSVYGTTVGGGATQNGTVFALTP
jgi:uncharacterized repeat protein (TIGR03803 family)